MRNFVPALVVALWSAQAPALPLTLISCASGQYLPVLSTIRPGADAAGIVMSDREEARVRAELVTHSGVENMMARGDQTAIVRVLKPLDEKTFGDITCVIFTGELPGDTSVPQGQWTSQRK